MANDGGGREEGGGDPGILAFSASSYIIREGGWKKCLGKELNEWSLILLEKLLSFTMQPTMTKTFLSVVSVIDEKIVIVSVMIPHTLAKR